MELKRLEALAALEREGTVSAAAAALERGQPTVSHHLRKLEEETGAVLVQRVGRGVRLTPEGRRLAARAREILALMHRAEVELDAATTLASGHVRLAAFPSACSTLVPHLLERLQHTVPGLSVGLVEAEPPEAARLLRAGEVDVAITFAFSGQRFDDDVTVEHLGWDALHLVEPRDGARVLGGVDSGGVEEEPLVANRLTELAEAQWIAGCQRCRTGLVELCASVGVEPRIAFASDDAVAVQALVAAGFGVTLLPELAIAGHRNASVVTREVSGAGRELQVATFGAPPRPAAVEEVVQTLLELA